MAEGCTITSTGSGAITAGHLLDCEVVASGPVLIESAHRSSFRSPAITSRGRNLIVVLETCNTTGIATGGLVVVGGRLQVDGSVSADGISAFVVEPSDRGFTIAERIEDIPDLVRDRIGAAAA